ncbi:MAG: alkaline phosphatase family protein [Clostridia bacterium]|nr:alkaline phosphatase family protein [Clostridia bacterium]
MKKKILSIIAILLVVIGVTLIFTVAIPKLEYAKDSGDTEELFRQNIALVGYENTVETAIPQTELYSIVKNHFESPLADGKTEKKAIIIGYDGCRADVLTEIRDEKSAISTLLHDGASINLSYCGGVNYPAPNTQDTSTAPGWCSILTGVWADKHGITANSITKSLEYKTLLTSLVEDGTINSSTFITRWKGHFDRKNATYNEEKAYCEENNLNVSFNRCENDVASHEYTLNEVKKSDCADFIFVIYEPTDSVGHDYGFTINNPGYKEAFQTADQYGLETLDAIKARETYETEDWLIIIASDHGGICTDHGGESIQERMTFIVTNKEFKYE